MKKNKKAKEVVALIMLLLEIGTVLGLWLYAMISQYIGWRDFMKL